MKAACRACARRSALLEMLSVRLDFRTRDLDRFWALLALGDEQLIGAIGGRRRGLLEEAHRAWMPDDTRTPADVQGVCRHQPAYPQALKSVPLAPRALYTWGEPGRLEALLGAKAVAVVGTRMASDYGSETARALARDLAASGICVVGALGEGIALAAHTGALEARGPTLGVVAGGVERCSPACCGAAYRGLRDWGCLVSELPCGARPSRWSQLARVRTVVLLADLVIVVEALEEPRELACAELARGLGTLLAAVPGRVCSALARGTNRLIREGAPLVRDAQDVLDLLYGAGERDAGASHADAGDASAGAADAIDAGAGASRGRPLGVEPRLRATLERVGRGKDTLAKLSEDGVPFEEATLALAELELSGLLVRGDGGRYVPVPAGRQDSVPRDAGRR